MKFPKAVPYIFLLIVAALVLGGGVGVARAQCEATELAKLTASDAGNQDEFGTAVAIYGHIAVIGAIYDDDMAQDAGAAYVYRFDGSAWG